MILFLPLLLPLAQEASADVDPGPCVDKLDGRNHPASLTPAVGAEGVFVRTIEALDCFE